MDSVGNKAGITSAETALAAWRRNWAVSAPERMTERIVQGFEPSKGAQIAAAATIAAPFVPAAMRSSEPTSAYAVTAAVAAGRYRENSE